MKRRIMAAITAAVMLLSMGMTGVFASDAVEYSYTHTFDNWHSYYAEGKWRLGGGANSYTNGVIGKGAAKYGAETPNVYFSANGVSDYGYLNAPDNAAAVIDTANNINYLRISFDVALENSNSLVRYMNQKGGKFFEISMSGIKLMNTAVTLPSDIEAKRWYTIDMVEHTDGTSATWNLYVDGSLIAENAAGSVITAPYGNQYIFTSNGTAGSAFYFDNFTIAASSEAPVISEKTVNVIVTDADVKIVSSFPRSVSVPINMTVSELLSAINMDNLSSADILNEDSQSCGDDEAAAGKYLCVADDNNSVIYTITGVSSEVVPVEYSYTHTFDNWHSYYAEGKWRLGGGANSYSNGVIGKGAAKYGAETPNVYFSANGVSDYGYLTEADNPLAVINTENNINYLRISFDIALGNSNSYMCYIHKTGSKFFEISMSGIKLMNTAVTLPSGIEGKRWYTIDMVEHTDGTTATWNLYIDGSPAAENVTGSVISSPWDNSYRYTSNGTEGSEFYLDNLTIAASNVMPQIAAQSVNAASDNAGIYIRNEFPRTIVTASATTVEELLAAIKCENAELAFKNENSETITTGAAIGGYLAITLDGKNYIYNVTNGLIKDTWNSGSGLYTNHSQWSAGTSMGISTSVKGGIGGKDEADLAKYYSADSLNITGGNSFWFIIGKAPYNGIISAPQTYSIEMFADGSFEKYNWMLALDGIGNMFPIQIYANGSMGSFGTGNVHKYVKGQWYKIDTVIYPSERKIDVYVNGEKVNSKTFEGTGDLAVNLNNGNGCRIYPDFKEESAGKSVQYAADNYCYYVGVPSYAEEDIPSADFGGCSVIQSFWTNEVISVNNAFGSDAISTAGTYNIYDDAEGIKTIAVRSDSDITTYYRVTEISAIEAVKTDSAYTAKVTAKISSIASKPVLAAAVYKDNKLTDVKYKTIENGENEVSVSASDGGAASAMLLESFRTLRPLTEAKPFE